MPKKSIEISAFTEGIVSTPSSTDTNDQSAQYSLNIDAHTSAGRLQGIDFDKILTVGGFKSDSLYASEYKQYTYFTFSHLNSEGTTVSDYAANMITVADKKNTDRINLVIGKSSLPALDIVERISIVENILSDYISE